MKCALASYKLLFVILVYSNISFSVNGEETGEILPSILWDPRNPLFSCPNPIITVKKLDSINFVFQKKYFYPMIKKMTSVRDPNYVNRIYLLKDEQNYKECNATTGTEIKYEKSDHVKLVFNVNAATGLPTFELGKTYYLISTSDGTTEGLNQKVNGSCATSGKDIFPLKLAVRVCAHGEPCDRCKTTSCYVQDCAFGDWEDTSVFVMNQTTCLQKMIRKCQSSILCDAPDEKFVPVSKDKCSTPDCSVSRTPVSTKSTCMATTTTLATTVVVMTTTTSISIRETVSTIRETVTETATITRTATISNSVTVPPPKTQRYITYEDIGYDKKFYITVVSAILGSLLVGIFVCHACVSYYKGRKVSRRVVNAEQYKSLQVDTDGSVKKVNYNNGTINTTHA